MIAKVFPKLSGFEPYEAKNTTPFFLVKTYDTPYTVKSHGFDSFWYTFATTFEDPSFSSGNLRWKSNSPLVKWYSGKSYPLEVSQFTNTSEQFGIRYKGWFTPESTTATFIFRGTGSARFKHKDVFVTSTISLGLDGASSTEHRLSSLTVGVPTLIEIYYWSLGKGSEIINSFCVNWKDPTLTKAYPISAGYVQSDIDKVSGLTSATIDNIVETTLTSSVQNLTEFKFTVPIVSSTASVGFQYIKTGNFLQDVQTPAIQIKQFRMIEYHTGYKYPGGSPSLSTLTKFVGQIRGWDIKRSSNGNSVANVRCLDWGSFLSDSINSGYPNVSDYLAAGLLDRDFNGVAGDTKPRTYDGWQVEDALDSLLINANIDPRNLIQKKKHVDTDDGIVGGAFLMDVRNADAKLTLDRNFKYGSPNSAVANLQDDPYLWQFSLGEGLDSNIQKIKDNYGFVGGFNHLGYYFIKSVKNPESIKSIYDVTFTGSWNVNKVTGQIKGISRNTNTKTDKVVATYIGLYTNLIFGVAPGYGTLDIRLSNPTLGDVITASYSTNHTSSRKFFDGIDDTIGFNPCILRVGEGLDYGSYSLNITNSSNSTIEINAFFVYDYPSEDVVQTFRSSDTAITRAHLIDNLSVKSSAEDVRNDAVVIGKLKGIKTLLAVSPEGVSEDIINPNNPVSNYVIARTVDRASIGSVSNINYVGRQLQTIIIEPSIGDEERAGWLSTEFVNRFNTLEKSLSPQLNILGNPRLEIRDKVDATDALIGSVTTSHNYWISNVTEKHTNAGKYIGKVTLESSEPWTSFFRYPVPSIGAYPAPMVNGRVYNTGYDIRFGSAYDNLVVLSTQPDTLNCFIRPILLDSGLPTFIRTTPQSGYLRMQREIIRYRDVSVTLGEFGAIDFTFQNLDRNLFGTPTLNFVPEKVEGQISPYSSEEFGINPAISFDLVYPGFVRVIVQDHTGALLDVLSVDGSKTFEDDWVALPPGSYRYSWPMLDRSGKYNETNAGAFALSGTSSDSASTRPSLLGQFLTTFHVAGKSYGSTGIDGEAYKMGGGGFYVHNMFDRKQGEFNFVVQYLDISGDFFTSIQTMPQVQKIYTILRERSHTPTGNDPNTSRDQDNESLNVGINSSLDPSSLSFLWWSQRENAHILPRGGIPGPQATDFALKYLGNETDGVGLGAKFTIKNEFPVARLAKLEVTRYITTFVKLNFDVTYFDRATGETLNINRGMVYVIDAALEDPIIEGSGFDYRIDGSNGIVVYVQGPRFVPFITAGMALTLGADKPPDIGFSDTDVVTIKYRAVSHVHTIVFRATDFSGRISVYKRSLFWVAPAFHNTITDWSSGNPKAGWKEGEFNDSIWFNKENQGTNPNYLITTTPLQLASPIVRSGAPGQHIIYASLLGVTVEGR